MTINPKWRSVVRSAPSLVLGAIAATVVVHGVNGRQTDAATEVLAPVLRSDAVSRVARDRARSVVLLHAIVRDASSPQGRELFREPVQEALGSGIVIDSNGLILTNAHVIAAAGVVHVRRPDGENVATTVVGTDADTDLALVRVSDASGLRPAPLGDSDRLDVGSFVIAVGSPLGLHHTVTSGVLSAKARGLDESGMEFLQTDAAVNPGSSGGPLLDLSGRVIGVITSMLSAGGENVGLNFAIPINTVKELLPALRENRVRHGWLGAETSALTAAGAKAFGLARPGDGLLISSVEPAGPAAQAGIQPRDVLLGLASTPPVAATGVPHRLRTMAPGERLVLRVLRDGKRIEVPVVLGTRSPQDGAR